VIIFLIKKTLYVLWDNLFALVLLNLGFAASAALPLFLLPLLAPMPALFWAAACIFLLWLCWYTAACGFMVKKISDYDAMRFADFGPCLKRGFFAGVTLAIAVAAACMVVVVAIPFYLRLSSSLGLLLAGALFWALVIALLSFQFFLGGMRRLDKKVLKNIKKCFIIFADNPLFSLFCLFAGLILSCLLVTFPSGVLLFMDEALRLRLFKYDWLSDHPEIDAGPRKVRAKKIPWAELLAEEREQTGTRGWRDFVFPWKG
jgi:hypothetical protein